MSAPPPIRAYLVDLDGTLYHHLPVKLGMALELVLFGISRIPWLRAFRHEHETMRALQGQRFEPSPFEAQLTRTSTKLGVPATDLHAVVRRWMIERPQKWIAFAKNKKLIAEIYDFHKSGGKTALVSDYPATAKLEALGAKAAFDLIISNGETDGLERLKPSPDGYLMAAERLGVSPEECLVIGDRDDADGAAARAAGMRFRLVK
jgi:HAD superfamily hydrolase (TIGR01549 family)